MVFKSGSTLFMHEKKHLTGQFLLYKLNMACLHDEGIEITLTMSENSDQGITMSFQTFFYIKILNNFSQKGTPIASSASAAD